MLRIVPNHRLILLEEVHCRCCSGTRQQQQWSNVGATAEKSGHRNVRNLIQQKNCYQVGCVARSATDQQHEKAYAILGDQTTRMAEAVSSQPFNPYQSGRWSLPAEILAALPTDAFLQLELAHKICCHAYTQQVWCQNAVVEHV